MVGNLIERALRDELIDTFQDPGYRPPLLPSVAVQLLELTRNDEAAAEDAVRVLEQDQLLAGLVLRIASSPLYAGRSPIASLRQAVVRIGLAPLRSIVFDAALRQGVFDLPNYREAAERLLQHGTAAAYIARFVGASCGVDPEIAFLCGLLHDIGFSALLFSVSDAEDDSRRKLEDLWKDLDGLHERASGLVTRLWRLSPEICQVVGNHHHLAVKGGSRVAAVVCIADWLTERFGAHVLQAPRPGQDALRADCVLQSDVDAARELLGIDDEKLTSVVEGAEKVVQAIPKA